MGSAIKTDSKIFRKRTTMNEVKKVIVVLTFNSDIARQIVFRNFMYKESLCQFQFNWGAIYNISNFLSKHIHRIWC